MIRNAFTGEPKPKPETLAQQNADQGSLRDDAQPAQPDAALDTATGAAPVAGAATPRTGPLPATAR